MKRQQSPKRKQHHHTLSAFTSMCPLTNPSDLNTLPRHGAHPVEEVFLNGRKASGCSFDVLWLFRRVKYKQ
ncbi:hypothetical protein Bpfe_007273 [Biomphalaria pfeifferi]|uniref:Uncharacterized protein n=1 Tax=Biomphalaria pfeifferi TaxID=112525 RepID=A0AAD8FFH2_BIOPF|nr:hypothetical protein Bpfe_007273 [Biomphalaria pfeifferi]